MSYLHPLAPKILQAATVLALGVAGCSRQTGGPSAVPPQEVAVVTLQPRRVELTRELPGRTAAFVIAEVRPQVNGIVQQRLFDEGANVRAGQVLYQIDDATYRADLHAAQGALERARAAAEIAKLNAERSATLAKTDAVSRQENETALATYDQAKAEVRAAEAAVEHAEITLGYARVTSPIDGQIGRSSVTQGALVTANQPAPLAIVQQLDPIYVDVTQSSREWVQLRRELDAGTLARAELPVTIMLEDGTRYPHPGRFEFAEVSVDPSTGAIGLRIVVPNGDHLILPGMYVRAIVGTAVRDDAIVVAQQGITREPGGKTSALVVTAAGIVEKRDVSVSRTIGADWLVESGLAPGDKVVVQGLQKIAPGMPVRAVEFDADARKNGASN